MTGSLITLASSLNSTSSVDSLLNSSSSREIDLNGLLGGSTTSTSTAKSSSLLDITPITTLDSTLASLLQPTAFI